MSLTSEFSILACLQLHLYMLSFCYLRNIFGALAMFCVHCQLPLSMTRIQYCFLALCVWILILLTNTLMKTFGGLWNWLTWRTLCHPFLINWITSVLRVVRTSGRSKNSACESSNGPQPWVRIGGGSWRILNAWQAINQRDFIQHVFSSWVREFQII